MAALTAVATVEGGAPLTADVDAFAAEIDEALAALREAVDKAGLRRDAYGAVIEAQARALALMPGFLRSMTHLLDRGRVPLDPTSLSRLEKAATVGADRRAAELARAHNSRTILIAVVALVSSIIVACSSGYWWGHASALAGVHETEAQLASAFRSGATGAAEWLNLMRNNDLPAALATCKGDTVFTDQLGARACMVPLRIALPRLDAAKSER